MQCRKHQVAGFSKLDGVFHGLTITDFADQNHIRCLTQGIPQCRYPVFRIHTHFTMGNDTAFVGMHILDWVFDGDDVSTALFVAIIQHRRKTG